MYVSLKCVSTSGLPDMPGRCIQVPFLSFQTCLFSSWKAAALEAAWHHICSARAGVVSRIKSLSPASLMLRSVKKQCGKKKKKTTQEKGKKKSKKQPTKNFCLWIQKSPLHARFIYIKLVMTFQVSLRLKCLLDHLKLLSRAPATLLTWRAGLLRV